jgi:hypothetical protein
MKPNPWSENFGIRVLTSGVTPDPGVPFLFSAFLFSALIVGLGLVIDFIAVAHVVVGFGFGFFDQFFLRQRNCSPFLSFFARNYLTMF